MSNDKKKIIDLTTRLPQNQSKPVIDDSRTTKIYQFPPRLFPLPKDQFYQRNYRRWAVLAAGVSIVSYFTFCRGSSLEEEIRSTLQPVKQEYTHFCHENEMDITIYGNQQKLAWAEARRDEILRLYGCASQSVEWTCLFGFRSSAGITSERYKDPLQCAGLSTGAEYGISDAQHGTGIWDYDSWKKQQEAKNKKKQR